MAGINGIPVNAMGAVGVPVSKYISNATHVGAAQQTGKDATQVQDTTSAPPAAQAEEAQFVPGLKVSSREDGTQCFQAQSGLVMNTTADSKITSIEVPGEGLVQRQADGSLAMELANGAVIPVRTFGNEQTDFLGYTYTRNDGTAVHINLADMAVGYVKGDQEKGVWQEVEATGTQVISTRTNAFDPKDGKKTQLITRVTVFPDGAVEVEGHDKDLQLGANRIQFKDLTNFTQTFELPQAVPALIPPARPEPPVTPKTANTGPIFVDDTPPPPQPEPPVNIPAKPVVHALLPSQIGFDRDEAGQTGITFPSGVSFIYTTNSGGALRDPRVMDRLLPCTVENFTSADGRLEKQFKFEDAVGIKYRCFQESMDVLVDSQDGKVRQHILPNGTILGQVQGPDGQFRRFEVTPRGEVKADPGISVPPSSGGRTQAYWTGADGKTVPIALPYPIPADQANSGMYADMYGTPKYPQSGERLPAFAEGGSPPNSGPIPPGPPPGTQAPGPMAGFDPNQGPMAGTSFVPSQPPPQPGGYNPPPNMGPYPGTYTGYPGGSTWSPNYQQQAPYPGQGPQTPGFTGQQPGYPGEMPDMPTLMEKMKADFDRTNAMMWGQLAQSSATTQMMTMGQTMNSAMYGLQFGMAMWPRTMFPFCW
ncbi:MAG: hypothetical protein KF760_00185 [Candidatus Eremiobacteraeota bacterium]|nr:hypothetical protein [Candidatus Eremiobacteraeota bacterium]MCW5866619.1 hypothetical protein [Candidatus Eremiobacteraeota bacterium]